MIDDPYDEVGTLYDLTTILGPLPEEWINSIGAEACPQNVRFFFNGFPGTSYSSSTCDISLEQMVPDTLGLIALLQQILVFDPLRRPDVSDFVHHPWFAGSSSPATSSRSPSERSFSTD